MITKIVTYEINQDGDCDKCDCLIEYEYHNYCKAFDTTMNCYGNKDQCQECKDYIAEQKAKQDYNGASFKIKGKGM